MAQDRDEDGDGLGVILHLESEPWPDPVLTKKCDPPAGATSLAEFVRAEAGDELAAIRAAFEPLAKARGSAEVTPACDAFAMAVHRFHERARQRLITGEVAAFGRLPGPWAEYVRIPADGWRNLIWGDIGDWDGLGAIIKTRNWQPRPRDAWLIGHFDEIGAVELPGGADLTAEIAYAWMTDLRLDDVAVGACPGKGWRVLGLQFNRPAERLFACLVVDATSLSPEEACSAWLRGEVAAGPPSQTKTWYREQAQSRWPSCRGGLLTRFGRRRRAAPKAGVKPAGQRNKSKRNRNVYYRGPSSLIFPEDRQYLP